MKKMKLLCGLMLLAGISVSGTALADRGHGGRGHVGIGVYLGTPYLYPYYLYPSPYYYPYSYYPPVVVTPAQPPVYIEQPESQSAPQDVAPSAREEYYWYHCDKPEGYYPYIKACPGGWQKVEPTPPPQP
jgi:hypothetical protein